MAYQIKNGRGQFWTNNTHGGCWGPVQAATEYKKENDLPLDIEYDGVSAALDVFDESPLEAQYFVEGSYVPCATVVSIEESII